jgi:type VI secretion system protein VasI
MQPDVEYGMTDSATTRIRFDNEQARTVTMGISTDGEALFLGKSITVETLMQHDEMVFGFTPFNSSPVETTFDLRGLSEAIKPLQGACNW